VATNIEEVPLVDPRVTAKSLIEWP